MINKILKQSLVIRYYNTNYFISFLTSNPVSNFVNKFVGNCQTKMPIIRDEVTIVIIYKGMDITKRFFKSGPAFNTKGDMPNRRHNKNEKTNVDLIELSKNILSKFKQ